MKHSFKTSLKEIETAIGNVSPQEYEELLSWLGDHTQPHSIDAQLKADSMSGAWMT